MKYKAILLVLASEDIDVSIFKKIKPEWKPLYPFMRKVYESYMYEHPEIKVLFVYGNGTTCNYENYDLVYNVEENLYPGMIHKTMNAIQYINDNFDYDHLIRTNLSTFWDFNKLSDRLDKLPKINCVTGTPVNIKDKDGNLYSYTSGFDLIMSRDVAEKIVPHKDEIIASRVWLDMEDLALCNAFEKYADCRFNDYGIRNDVSIMTMNEYSEDTYKARKADADSKNIDHFRAKTRTDRNVDKIVLQKLLLDVYGKTVL